MDEMIHEIPKDAMELMKLPGLASWTLSSILTSTVFTGFAHGHLNWITWFGMNEMIYRIPHDWT